MKILSLLLPLVVPLMLSYMKNLVIPRQSIYLAVGEFQCQKEKAEDFAKGIDANMARFYRSQPGVHVYVVGIHEPTDKVVLAMVASNKELFNKLPLFPDDLEKLNAARGPFFSLLQGCPEEARRFSEAKFTVGNFLGHLPKATPDDSTVRWDDVMNTPYTSERNTLYMAITEMKVKEGMAEECAKGLDAAMGDFYRRIPECLLYMYSVKDENTAMGATIWTSKEAFDSEPKDSEDLKRIKEARAPYFAMLLDNDSEAYRLTETTVVVGQDLFKGK